MACCGICDDQENDEIMRSIKRDRGCTDILWLLAFIMSWVGLIYIIIQAEADGANPERVYKGNVN